MRWFCTQLRPSTKCTIDYIDTAMIIRIPGQTKDSDASAVTHIVIPPRPYAQFRNGGNSSCLNLQSAMDAKSLQLRVQAHTSDLQYYKAVLSGCVIEDHERISIPIVSLPIVAQYSSSSVYTSYNSFSNPTASNQALVRFRIDLENSLYEDTNLNGRARLD